MSGRACSFEEHVFDSFVVVEVFDVSHISEGGAAHIGMHGRHGMRREGNRKSSAQRHCMNQSRDPCATRYVRLQRVNRFRLYHVPKVFFAVPVFARRYFESCRRVHPNEMQAFEIVGRYGFFISGHSEIGERLRKTQRFFSSVGPVCAHKQFRFVANRRSRDLHAFQVPPGK